MNIEKQQMPSEFMEDPSLDSLWEEFLVTADKARLKEIKEQLEQALKEDKEYSEKMFEFVTQSEEDLCSFMKDQWPYRRIDNESEIIQEGNIELAFIFMEQVYYLKAVLKKETNSLIKV